MNSKRQTNNSPYLTKIFLKSKKYGEENYQRSVLFSMLRGQSWRSIRNCRLGQTRDWCARGAAALAYFFQPSTLTSDIFAASLPTRKNSTSFERSNSYLFGEWKPRPWHNFWYDLWSLKVPSFHIIQRPLLKQKLPALYY